MNDWVGGKEPIRHKPTGETGRFTALVTGGGGTVFRVEMTRPDGSVIEDDGWQFEAIMSAEEKLHGTTAIWR